MKKSEEIVNAGLDQELVLLLKAAGYYLNKNIGNGSLEDAAELFVNLGDKEKILLSKLMKKCIKAWKV